MAAAIAVETAVVMAAAAAANNVVGDDVGDNNVTWLSMADNGGVTAADNNMGDDDGWVNGGQRCGRWRRATRGPRVSRYEACRMEEIEMSLT